MKYKCIKTYPGSPELGTVHSSENKTYDWLGTNFYNKYPEFWEKVEEKTYEILSYKYELVFSDNGQSKDFLITSVKRLSDGEVFTLGDTTQTVGKYPHTIISMEIRQKNKDGERGVYDGTDRIWLNWEGDAGGNWLENVEKVKQPLFQTNDGVDIHKGDTFYYVNDKWVIFDYTVNCHSSFLPSINRTSFSNKEKAEEWVLWNKKELNLNDVYQTMLSSCYADILDNLKEIVKLRL